MKEAVQTLKRQRVRMMLVNLAYFIVLLILGVLLFPTRRRPYTAINSDWSDLSALNNVSFSFTLPINMIPILLITRATPKYGCKDNKYN